MSDSPKRPCYQFSLRTLLIVMLVSCFVFAWVGSRMQRARENRDRVAAVEDAVAAIENMGGGVVFKYEDLRPQTWLEKQFDDPGDADYPAHTLKVTVVFFGPNVTDAGLEHLKGLTALEALIVQHWTFSPHSQETIDVTDAGLAHLKGLTNLRTLGLSSTNVTDEGVKKLQQALPNCKIVR